MDIAVLGSNEFVLGFRLGGVKRVYTVKPENYEAEALGAPGGRIDRRAGHRFC